jgi:hypothetical protein
MQVIMISGFPDEIVVQQGLTPLVPILQKPFPPKRLSNLIESVLTNPQSERTVASLVRPVDNSLESKTRTSGV